MRYALGRTEDLMPEYQLYCFAQSGNAYRAALMLNLIGADWQPVYVDFFKGGETITTTLVRDCKVSSGCNSSCSTNIT